MTFEEMLKSLGYTDEQIKAIMSGMTEHKIYLSAEEKIDERYGKLKEQHDATSTQLKDAQDLIKQLQPLADGNEAAQAKIADYEKQVKAAEERAAKAERNAAVKVELLANGAVPEDVDYLMFRIENGDVEVKVGDDGKLSGMDDAVKALKTAHPNQFREEQAKKIDENKLPKGEPGAANAAPQSLEEALQAHYENNE